MVLGKIWHANQQVERVIKYGGNKALSKDDNVAVVCIVYESVSTFSELNVALLCGVIIKCWR